MECPKSTSYLLRVVWIPSVGKLVSRILSVPLLALSECDPSVPSSPLADTPGELFCLLTSHFTSAFAAPLSPDTSPDALPWDSVKGCTVFSKKFAHSNIPAGTPDSVLFRLWDSLVHVLGRDHVSCDLPSLPCPSYSDFLACLNIWTRSSYPSAMARCHHETTGLRCAHLFLVTKGTRYGVQIAVARLDTQM